MTKPYNENGSHSRSVRCWLVLNVFEKVDLRTRSDEEGRYYLPEGTVSPTGFRVPDPMSEDGQTPMSETNETSSLHCLWVRWTESLDDH